MANDTVELTLKARLTAGGRIDLQRESEADTVLQMRLLLLALTQVAEDVGELAAQNPPIVVTTAPAEDSN